MRVATSVKAAVLVLGVLLGWVALAGGANERVDAQGGPSQDETARLLGYLWADGQYDDGVWNANGPSGAGSLIEHLANKHGANWIDRSKLTFRLPAPYNWADWKDSLPNDDATTRAAVENPHFLAALLEGEGSTSGLVYDQNRCCTPGYTSGRMTDLEQLLQRRGYQSAAVVTFNNVDSGEVWIGGGDITQLRQQLLFVCPADGSKIRVPGGEDFGAYGSVRWLNANNTPWSGLTRTDCVNGQSIPQVQPPSGTCVASVRPDGSVQLSWTFPRGDISIRRNGTYVTMTSALDGQWTETPSAGTYEYSVRGLADGLKTDAGCGTVDTANPPQPEPPAPEPEPEPPAPEPEPEPPAPEPEPEPPAPEPEPPAPEPEAPAPEAPAPAPEPEPAPEAPAPAPTPDAPDAPAPAEPAAPIAPPANEPVAFAPEAAAVDDAVLTRCRGRVPTIIGTDASEIIKGTAGDDVIDGGGGNDIIYGLGGNDIICGGAGVDAIHGGDGRDILLGQGGNDWIEGGNGRDRIAGGVGGDVLMGNGGRDRILGGGGDDIIDGGGGNDRLDGRAGNDQLQGGRLIDSCRGGAGLDVLFATCEGLAP